MQKDRNIILSLTGPTCSGKTSILRALCKGYEITQLVGHTTRDIRPGEVDGVDVTHVSKEQFLEGLEKGNYFQHLNFHGTYYGTTWDQLEQARFGADGVRIPAVIFDPTGLRSFEEVTRRTGLAHFPVYIDAETDFLVGRYFERETEESLSAKPMYHLNRIRGILKEAVEWPEMFHYLKTIYNNDQHPRDILHIASVIAELINAKKR